MKELLPECCYHCPHEKEFICDLLQKDLRKLFKEQDEKGIHMCPLLICPLRNKNENG